MQIWEYKSILSTIPEPPELHSMIAEGWELVSVVCVPSAGTASLIFYLKKFKEYK